MLKIFKTAFKRGARQLATLQRKQTASLLKSLTGPTQSRTRKTKAAARSKSTAHPSKPLAAGSWKRAVFVTGIALGKQDPAPGKRMLYWLYQPPTDGAKALPLVVMLHGCEQTASDFANGTRMNLLADKKGFAVLYPQQSAQAQRNRCWPWYRKSIQHGGGEAAVIGAMICRMVAQHGFDASRVYLAGMSAGAGMAHSIALNFPHLVAAVGLHSGPVFGAAANSLEGFAVMQRGALALPKQAGVALATIDTMPAILLHGARDSVVRPINLHQLEQQFCQHNGLSAANRQPAVHRAGGKSASAAHAFDTVNYVLGKRTLLRVCQISQLDHAWSGGDPNYRFNQRKGPDASLLMWRFFAQHRRLADSRERGKHRLI
jgi:poly(hydroxyalkanoate) depolymerase family esterase